MCRLGVRRRTRRARRDCISLIDDATITLINGVGGLHAIAISHPHFYTTLVDWSRAFGDVPVHLHANEYTP
jgi:hypothetical protein